MCMKITYIHYNFNQFVPESPQFSFLSCLSNKSISVEKFLVLKVFNFSPTRIIEMGSQRYTQNDLLNFDWDDGPLIAAYDKAKAKADAKIKRQAKKQSSNQQSSSEDKQWTVGSFCRALYSEDGYYYEAKVLEMDDDGRCLVEFLGYEDTEEVDVDDLKPSKGKKARKSQLKSIEDTSRMSLTCGETSDAESVSVASSAAKEKRRKPRVVDDEPEPDFSAMKNKLPNPYRPMPLPPYMMAPPPLPPPIGHSPNIANDPALAALLRAWYMAGYYLGQYEQQTQRGTPYSAAPCCCGHSNHCC